VVAGQAETQLNTQTRAIFEASFPGAAVVDPVLQMRRQLNELRPRHGGLRDDDMLTLLAALADALGTASRDAITRIAYESGALEVGLAPALEQKDRQTLIASLAMRGVTAQPPVGGSNDVLTLRRSAP
jgi:general secretion pathway protein L